MLNNGLKNLILDYAFENNLEGIITDFIGVIEGVVIEGEMQYYATDYLLDEINCSEDELNLKPVTQNLIHAYVAYVSQALSKFENPQLIDFEEEARRMLDNYIEDEAKEFYLEIFGSNRYTENVIREMNALVKK